MKDFTEELIQTLDSRQQELADLSREIWEYAELSEEEHRSSRRLAAYLKENGFAVEEGVCGLPTAFCAKWGSGNPVISFLGEYDALPGLSQKALPEQAPAPAGPFGSSPAARRIPPETKSRDFRCPTLHRTRSAARRHPPRLQIRFPSDMPPIAGWSGVPPLKARRIPKFPGSNPPVPVGGCQASESVPQ